MFNVIPIVKLLPTILAALVLARGAAADTSLDRETSLIITYQATPSKRIAFLQEMAGPGLRHFQEWKAKGLVKSYHVLANRYADAGTWDAMAILTFAGTSDLSLWASVEKAMPGGLDPCATALVDSINTAPADLIRDEAAPPATGPAKKVYLEIPYEYLVPADEYKAYLDGYTIPQLKGWIRRSALTGYGVYLSRYPAGRAWNAALLLEYRGDDGLAARESAVGATRVELKDDPKWMSWAESKKSIRREGIAVVADELLPPDGESKADDGSTSMTSSRANTCTNVHETH